MPFSKKLSPPSLPKFYRAFLNLDLSHQLLALSFLLLAFLYPGHNSIQLLTLSPGPLLDPHSISIPLSDYPLSDSTPPPETSSRGVVIQDVSSKTILYSHNPDTHLLPASTTKLMTALVALSHYSLDDQVVISSANQAIGHSMGLVEGETITVHNLLYGLLVESGNDAALALANHFPTGYQGFVDEMNKMALDLHLYNTSYRNPSGVESYNHYTTARDLSTLASFAAENKVISQIVQTKRITIKSTDGKYSHHLESTNQLLGVVPGMIGMKTGWTENAGECLVTYVEREGRGVITVVLGSNDRFGDTARLIDWVYDHHTWISIDN